MSDARTRVQVIADASRACGEMVPLPPPTETEVDPDDGSVVHRWVSFCGKETFSLTFTGNGMVTGYHSSPSSTEPAWRVPVADPSLQGRFPPSLRQAEPRRTWPYEGKILKGGWRDISSAPKDGTRILVCEADGQMYVTSWPAGSSERWFVDHGDAEEWYGDPDNPLTHWQPLPEPPTR